MLLLYTYVKKKTTIASSLRFTLDSNIAISRLGRINVAYTNYYCKQWESNPRCLCSNLLSYVWTPRLFFKNEDTSIV